MLEGPLGEACKLFLDELSAHYSHPKSSITYSRADIVVDVHGSVSDESSLD